MSVPDKHPRMRDDGNGQLTITNAHKKDSGFYQCRAINKIGVDLALTHLIVTGHGAYYHFIVCDRDKLRGLSPHSYFVRPCVFLFD